jgi:hypothetical protein
MLCPEPVLAKGSFLVFKNNCAKKTTFPHGENRGHLIQEVVQECVGPVECRIQRIPMAGGGDTDRNLWVAEEPSSMPRDVKLWNHSNA